MFIFNTLSKIHIRKNHHENKKKAQVKFLYIFISELDYLNLLLNFSKIFHFFM